MGTEVLDERTMYAWFAGGALLMLRALMPIIGGLLIIAFLGNVMQTGFVFSGDPLALKLDRLNPVQGMKNLISKKGLMRLGSSLGKVAVVAAVAFASIRAMFGPCTELSSAGIDGIIAFVFRSTYVVALRIALALLALALIDFLYQRWQYKQDMRMTKQEVRDELKRMEGDPLTRDRRRRMQRELAMQRMMADIPKADVVVTNPTEIAVALRYESGAMNAPRVVAKGQRLMAQRVREIAEAHGVPIVERKPLARALFQMCKVGDEVPVELYQAVAEVLAFVYELNRMKGRRPAAGVA
jgi:flagellar biosynthetic protein FlhB